MTENSFGTSHANGKALASYSSYLVGPLQSDNKQDEGTNEHIIGNDPRDFLQLAESALAVTCEIAVKRTFAAAEVFLESVTRIEIPVHLR